MSGPLAASVTNVSYTHNWTKSIYERERFKSKWYGPGLLFGRLLLSLLVGMTFQVFTKGTISIVNQYFGMMLFSLFAPLFLLIMSKEGFSMFMKYAAFDQVIVLDTVGFIIGYIISSAITESEDSYSLF